MVTSPFEKRDERLAKQLLFDVSLSIAHAQLDVALGEARAQLQSRLAQNGLREMVRSTLCGVSDRSLLLQRVARLAARFVEAEVALLFEFDVSKRTLWRAAASSREHSVPDCVRVDPLAPFGVVTKVALTGKPISHSFKVADPSLNLGHGEDPFSRTPHSRMPRWLVAASRGMATCSRSRRELELAPAPRSSLSAALEPLRNSPRSPLP